MSLPQNIDWQSLANQLGLITSTERGWTESGGARAGLEALENLPGADAIRASVDYYISGEPGSELARSVLWLLHPRSAMDRCHQIYLEADQVEDRRAAVELLRVVADSHALQWIPLYLNDPDDQTQMWGICIVDQLLTSSLVNSDDCAAILTAAASHPNEHVREKATWVRTNLTGL